jgi:hypothetical protein
VTACDDRRQGLCQQPENCGMPTSECVRAEAPVGIRLGGLQSAVQLMTGVPERIRLRVDELNSELAASGAPFRVA